MLEFKKGSYDLNDNPNFNFQLNRVIMWDGGTLEDIEKISGKIIDSASWKKELITLGNKAMEEKRTKEAIAYYRMSEFFMYDGDPDKKKYYKLATDMFYEYYTDYFDSGTVSRFEVSYESIKLPVMYAKAKGKKRILFFFMEEMTHILKSFSLRCFILLKKALMFIFLKGQVREG